MTRSMHGNGQDNTKLKPPVAQIHCAADTHIHGIGCEYRYFIVLVDAVATNRVRE